MRLKLLKLLIVLLPALGMLPPAYCQETVPVTVSTNKVVLEGKVYLLHTVKPGQTLFGISRAYNVDDKTIIRENPGVNSGLQIGQVLKIPFNPASTALVFTHIDTARFTQHYLKPGETIFALSRLYNVSAREIEDANPGMNYNNLPVGQLVLIPKISSTQSDQDYLIHKVKRRETLYRLSREYGVTEEEILAANPEIRTSGLRNGDKIRIPGKVVDIEEVVIIKDTVKSEISVIPEGEDSLTYLGIEELSQYLPDYTGRPLRISYLIPFSYHIPFDSIVAEQDIVQKGEQSRQKATETMPLSVGFLEFMEGSLLALDTLKKQGFHLEVQFFDTRRDSVYLRQLLQSPFINESDLIIGPFHSWAVKMVSEFSVQKNIPFVAPFYPERNVISGTPFLFQVNPSPETEFNALSREILTEYQKNLIFIYPPDSTEFKRTRGLKEQVVREFQVLRPDDSLSIKEIFVGEIARLNLLREFSSLLTRDTLNVVILPSASEALVSTVVTQLYYQLRDYQITVYGLPQWAQFQNLDNSYLHKLEYSFVCPCHFSYDDPDILSFLEKFRTHFKAEPNATTNKGFSYAFTGYDITRYFIYRMGRYGNEFLHNLNAPGVNNLLTDYYFRRLSNYGGFENTGLEKVKYHKDFTISSETLVPLPEHVWK
jgi:LysM repeat protein